MSVVCAIGRCSSCSEIRHVSDSQLIADRVSPLATILVVETAGVDQDAIIAGGISFISL